MPAALYTFIRKFQWHSNRWATTKWHKLWGCHFLSTV